LALHHRHELEVHELLPDLERGDEEVVDTGDGGGLEEQLRLRATLLPGDEHLGDRGRLGERELAMGLADEVAPQRDEEEDAQRPAREADEDGLPGMRVELQDVERRQREDRTGDHGPGHAADAGDDDVLDDRRAPPVDAGQPDGEDRDGDGRLHHLADLEAGVGGGHGEDEGEERAPQDGPERGLGQDGGRRHVRQVGLAGVQRPIGILGQRLRHRFVHPASRDVMGPRPLPSVGSHRGPESRGRPVSRRAV
jgi:hypothetical protein